MIYVVNSKLFNTIVNSYKNNSLGVNGFKSDEQVFIDYLHGRGIKNIQKVIVK